MACNKFNVIKEILWVTLYLLYFLDFHQSIEGSRIEWYYRVCTAKWLDGVLITGTETLLHTLLCTVTCSLFKQTIHCWRVLIDWDLWCKTIEWEGKQQEGRRGEKRWDERRSDEKQGEERRRKGRRGGRGEERRKKMRSEEGRKRFLNFHSILTHL